MKFSRKYLVEIITVSIVLIGVLSIANLIKFGYITKATIVNNRDFIDVLGNIATIFILVIGAGASYYRFFRGRIFLNTANININISIHKINSDAFLHVIDVELKNEGSFPIWEPAPLLFAYPHDKSGLGQAIIVEFWNPEIRTSAEHIQVIHPQESEQFYAFYRARKSTSAITYVVQIKSSKNEKWIKSVTISNALKSAG